MRQGGPAFAISGSGNPAFFPPPELHFPTGGPVDYNLALQETGRVQDVKAVCICQAEFVTASAGLRGISHLSPRWVEADLIADSCPTYFFRGEPKASACE